MKQLTIVVPVYNRASQVVETLDSIAASTCHDFELKIVDNASSDDSLTVCQQWARAHSEDGFPIEILSESRKGASIARNCGLKACKTDYIYFFDSDDLMSPDFISSLLPTLTKDNDMVFVPVRQEVNGVVTTRAYKKRTNVEFHLLNSMLNTLSMIFRTAFLKEIGSWNEALTTWDDWELGTRVLLHHPRICWLTERPFHLARVQENSQTGENFSTTLHAIEKTMSHVLTLLQQTTMCEYDQKRAYRAYYLRCMIFSGKLRKENNAEGENVFLQLAERCIPNPSRQLHEWGLFLKSYVAVGCRGAWRMALLSF